MKRRLRRAAVADLEETASWYDQQGAGLGDKFLEAAEAAFHRIEEHPLAYQKVRGELRRAPLPHPFPHQVFYIPRMGFIAVHAVLHPARDPAVWRRRL